VIALEGSAGHIEPRRESVELVEIVVAHEVAPASPAPQPSALVDETGHGRHDGVVEEELRSRWAADGGRGRLASARFDALLTRYREPHRHYHTVTHVLRVLRTVDELLAGTAVDDPGAVRLAAWYHDAVYDPRAAPAANETASAGLAQRDLAALGHPAPRTDAVVRLVLATVAHEPAAPDEAVMCDADLAVLAGDPATYEAYSNAVRAEYAHVDEGAWRTGRAAVLRAFLDRPVLFHTAAMADREPTARANLAAELASLR
jgi:predicted metal-dependent HD superfamily phosphohydrolase